MNKYADADYWDTRYEKEGQEGKISEWLEDYKSLKKILFDLMRHKDGKILHIGCGNSIIQEEMHDDGYKNITNIDISKPCIDQM